MKNDEMQNTWEQNMQAATDQWNWVIDDVTYAHITQYSGTENYCFQAKRGDYRLAGIIAGRSSAMRQADELIALPIEEFNRRVMIELIDELRKVERDILRLSPNTDLLPGYHAGFEDGVADMKRRIAAVIDLSDEVHRS